MPRRSVRWKRGEGGSGVENGHLAVHAGLELLLEVAGDDVQAFQAPALEPVEALAGEVGGAAVLEEAAGAAVVVEVVVAAQVGAVGHAVKGPCNVLRDAQPVLVDEAVLLARHTPSKPVPNATSRRQTCKSSFRAMETLATSSTSPSVPWATKRWKT